MQKKIIKFKKATLNKYQYNEECIINDKEAEKNLYIFANELISMDGIRTLLSTYSNNKKSVKIIENKYLSFKEAREWVHSLKLENKKDWKEYCNGLLKDKRQKPYFIPNHPYIVYQNNGWKNLKDWIGIKEKNIKSKTNLEDSTETEEEIKKISENKTKLCINEKDLKFSTIVKTLPLMNLSQLKALSYKAKIALKNIEK